MSADQPKLNILVRRDFSQKSYRMAMAVHAALLFQRQWELTIHAGAVYGPYGKDWYDFPNHGPVVAIYGVEDLAALGSWRATLGNLGGLASYEEPDLPDGQQLAALAWYGVMPADHGLRLL